MEKNLKNGSKKRSKKRLKKKLLVSGILIGMLLVILLAGYFSISSYFKTHFFPGTKINGIDCSRMTVEKVKERIQDGLQEYSLIVKERGDNSEVITAEMLSITYVDDQGVEKLLKKQEVYRWPSAIKGDKTYETAANIAYNKEGIDQVLDKLKCFQPDNVTAPVNASMEETEEGFSIVPEQQGNTLKREEVKNAVLDAVDTGKTEIDLEALDLYEKPEILSTNEELNARVQQLNTLISANIIYDFEDRQFTVDKKLIKSWLVKGEDGSYSIDQDQAANWVKEMAYETDTYSLTREFQTSTGQTITLPKHRGDYGWVINRDKTTQALLEAIQAGVQETREPEYLYKGVDRKKNDIGGTYVEICISTQTMWCYKNGNLVVQTPVVTGNHATGHDTPSGGVWAIDGKKADFDFKKYRAHSDFWLPFNGDVGIHDANWRTPEQYVPTTYENNGSHGCINTPRDAMEKIFNTVDIGYPVVIYFSPDQVVGPEPTQTEAGV